MSNKLKKIEEEILSSAENLLLDVAVEHEEKIDKLEEQVNDLSFDIDDKITANNENIKKELDDIDNKIKKIELIPGEKGDTGDKGDDGKDGVPGKDGKDGQDGIDGKDGYDGQDGKDGKDGENGKDGLPGKDGFTPDHKWEGTVLFFKNPDLSWGKGVDLIGPRGFRGIPGSGGGGGGLSIDAITKIVDDAIAAANFVKITGDTMTGRLTINPADGTADPLFCVETTGTNKYGLCVGTYDLTGIGYGKYATLNFTSNGALGNGIGLLESSLFIGDSMVPAIFGQAIGFLQESTLSILAFTPDWANNRIDVANLNVTSTLTGNIVIGDSSTTNAELYFQNTATSGTLVFKATDQTFEFDYNLLLPNKGLWFDVHSISPWERGDKISLFGNRFDDAAGYIIGVDSNTLYMRSPNLFDWQINELNDQFEKAYTMRLSPAGLIIGRGAAGVDYTLTFRGETNSGVLTWMEDEDYFRFDDDVVFSKEVSFSDDVYFGNGKSITGTDQNIVFDRSGFDAIYRNTGSTWVDYTTICGRTAVAGGSASLFPTNAYYANFGKVDQFSSIYIDVSNAAVGFIMEVEYSTGVGTWGTLTVIDGTSNMTVDGAITFTPPVDWVAVSLNSSPDYYWVRIRSTFTTTTDATVYCCVPSDGTRNWELWGNSKDAYPALKVDNNGYLYIGAPIVNSITSWSSATFVSTITSNSYLRSYIANTRETDTAGLILAAASNASGTYLVQNSPYQSFTGNAWTGAASQSVNFKVQNYPSNAATPTGELRWSYDLNGGGYATVLSLFSNGNLTLTGNLTMPDAKDIILNTTTGTKIGTATNQKLSFWNATPIIQPTTGVGAATLTGGGGTNITDTDTFDGYTLKQVVKALRNIGILA
jgi:hypothetical protein